MPLFTATNPVALMPGETTLLFNAESPTAPAASQAVALQANAGGGPADLSFTIAYATAPTAVLTVQAADNNVDGSFIPTSAVSTNKQNDRLELSTGAALVRIQLTTESAGVPLTVWCHRGA
ncbi:MAG: hypothetical protein ACREKE_07895 [bacterium]